MKIVDFGIAKTREGNKSNSTYVKGTLAYMSPEMRKAWDNGEKVTVTIDKLSKSDVFSLGMTFSQAFLHIRSD